MRYSFTEEQVALKETIDALFSKTVTSAWQRGLWDDELGRDPMFWKALSELGVTAIMLPEEAGGFGGTLTDLVPLFEAAGRYAVPDALVESVLVGPAAIALGGNEAQRNLLEGIVDGSQRVTIVLRPGSYVPDAHISDYVILPKENELWLYRSNEVELRRVYSEDPSRRLYEVSPNANTGERLVGSREAYDRLEAYELIATAAFLNGIASKVVQMSVDYSMQRKQFGRLIGSFQAVKHLLADSYSRNSLATNAARAASVSAALDGAVMARLVAGEAESVANHVALQVHGGIGFTFEHDLHIWLKRGKVTEQLQGGSAALAHRAGLAAIAAA